MVYDPTKDFLALLRLSGGAVSFERTPGLDWLVAALARAGVISLYVGQTAPIVNQTTTVWLRSSSPSWVAEGTVFLWNATTGQYEAATPALWNTLLSPPAINYSFQPVTAASATVRSGTSLIGIELNAPSATALLLPNLGAQFSTGRSLKIVDFSTFVVNHVITLSTPDGATIMQRATWQLLSTADQLAGVTLHPSPDLNSWVIAP